MASINTCTTQEGQTTYHVRIRLKGSPTQTATFQRLIDARKWIQNTESAIREGRHFKSSEAKKADRCRPHRSVFIGRFTEKAKGDKRPNLPTELVARSDWILFYSLADLTPAVIVEHRDSLLKIRSPATCNRYLAALSHALNTAVREWQWLEDSPLRKVKKAKEPGGRVRFLSDEERERLLQSCRESKSQSLYPIVVIALSTGMRQGKILNLEWKDVDLNQGAAILHETKNGERRRVPVTGYALESLIEYSKVRRLDSDLVFPGATDQPVKFRRQWLKALAEAQTSDFRFHDLRHSAASYLAMNGATPGEIAAVLGHKTLQMVKRYSHLSEAHTSKVVASMNAKSFGGRG